MKIDLLMVRRALKDAARDADRARVFVRSDKFEVPIDDRPEQRLMDALRHDTRARITVRGHAGSGKTSLIVHVLGHLPAFRNRSPAHVVVRLHVGGNPASFASADALQHAVLDGILAAAETPDGQFNALSYGIDSSAIAEVVANLRSVTPPTADSSFQVAIRPPRSTIGLVRTLKSEAVSLQTSTTPRARREVLERVVHAISAHDAVLTVIIDDTEHFASGNHGLDDPGVKALYSAVSALADLDLQLVVGFHPKFDGIDEVRAVVARSGFSTVDVAALPYRDGALAPIFDRRFELHGLPITTGEVFTSAAVTVLETAYHDGARHDYRHVLRVAQSACDRARLRGAEKVDGPDVKQVLGER